MAGCQVVPVRNSAMETAGLPKNSSDSLPRTYTMPMVVSTVTAPQRKSSASMAPSIGRRRRRSEAGIGWATCA